MNYSLTLTFLCSNGEKSSFSIDPVNKSISNDEVNALMNLIIEKNIFVSKNGDFVSKYNAVLTGKETSKFDLA